MPNASIKSEKLYKGRAGTSVLSNSTRNGGRATARRVDTGSYYDWSVRQLKKRAKELGMSGYSALLT